MTYNFQEYDKWRNSLTCDVCDEKHYRMGLCKPCYKKNRKESFHCTHLRCVNPVFGATLCQRHYRSYRQRCLICSSKNVYYRHLCRTHYRHASNTGNFPIEPKCSKENCTKKSFVDGLCLHHFKEKYSTYITCSKPNCEKKSHRRGLCCSHYFSERRKKEKTYINNQ